MKLIELLKNRGNFLHNRNVISQIKGYLIVGRRPSVSDKTKLKLMNFYHVNIVLYFVKKKKLYCHMKRCKFHSNEEIDDSINRRNNLMQYASLLDTDIDHKQLRSDVFSSIKCDDITLIAQNDDL